LEELEKKLPHMAEVSSVAEVAKSEVPAAEYMKDATVVIVDLPLDSQGAVKEEPPRIDEDLPSTSIALPPTLSRARLRMMNRGWLSAPLQLPGFVEATDVQRRGSWKDTEAPDVVVQEFDQAESPGSPQPQAIGIESSLVHIGNRVLGPSSSTPCRLLETARLEREIAEIAATQKSLLLQQQNLLRQLADMEDSDHQPPHGLR